MKKYLLLGALVALGVSAYADNQAYLYMDPTGDDFQYGSMRRVSANGKFAVGGDYSDYTGSFWIDLNEPEVMNYIVDGEAMDISNDGLIVGCMYRIEGSGESTVRYEEPGIYRNGEWEMLPIAPEKYGRGRAVAITPDGKYIAGYQAAYMEGKTRLGTSCACIWTYNEETEEYDLKTFNTQRPLDERGFVAYDISNDGRYIVGYQNYGCSSTVPAIYDVQNNELKLWNRLETRQEPFEYQGEVIGYFDEFFIDDFHDTDSEYGFVGAFMSIDSKGNAYGMRTHAINTEADPEKEGYGEGQLIYTACVYNVDTDEFTDIDADGSLLYGNVDNNVYFTTTGAIMQGDKVAGVEASFGVSPELPAAGLYHASEDGKVLAGSSLLFNEAIMEYVEVPLLVVLDEGIFSGVESMKVDNSNIRISAANGMIQVAGAKTVAIYNIDGSKVSNSANASVAPGMYIVKADNKVQKVLVK